MTFFGLTMENMLEEAGHKPSKEERKAKAAREAVINNIFSDEDDTKGSGFADPAVMFQ